MIAFALSLLLTSSTVILGPAAISEASPGVLEQVAETRIRYGYGLGAEDLSVYDALVAPPQCELLGHRGWLVADGQVLAVLVVDCGGPGNKMLENGLLADVNRPELVHKEGWLVLKP